MLNAIVKFEITKHFENYSLVSYLSFYILFAILGTSIVLVGGCDWTQKVTIFTF